MILRRASLLGLYALTFASSSCASIGAKSQQTLAQYATPAVTGWHRVSTPLFELVTDLGPEDSARAVEETARSVLALRAIMGNTPPPFAHQLTVYALKSDMEFERLFGRNTGGVAIHAATGSRLFLYGDPERWTKRFALGTGETSSVMRHEAAHAVLAGYLRAQPRWFAEGMAQYLDTFEWVDDGNVEFGNANLFAYRGYMSARTVTVQALKGWTRDAGSERTVYGFYGLSWALVHYLVNQEPERFGDLMGRLAEGDIQAAWDDVIAPLEPTLDAALNQYLKRGSYALARLPASNASFTATRIPLTQPEVEALHRDLEFAGAAKHKALDAQ